MTSLCKFLEMEHPEWYDFKEEIKEQAEEYAKTNPPEDLEGLTDCNPIKRALISHHFTSNSPEGKRLHLDSNNGGCQLTNRIYANLWKLYCNSKKGNTWECNDEKFVLIGRFGSDTMNSFKSIYNIFHEKFGDEAYKNVNLQEYAKLTHTIGNFTPIPFSIRFFRQHKSKCFNKHRGCNKRIEDMWDISLNGIKIHFEREYSVKIFRDYIDTFCLNTYVDKDCNVRPLFNKETRKLTPQPSPLPQTECELNEFLESANKKIIQRGTILVEILKGNICCCEKN
ncbi:MAG: hypothetical protein FWG68_00870 [Defluviitaleaceae bacterium]|nr:hypothetical protein [Defluviitaleaceae bacterium]